MNTCFLALDAGGGTFIIAWLLALILGFFLAICWIAFPFIVLSKFNELLKVTRQLVRSLNETNKGLQYLVDAAARQPPSPRE